jgi:hypothetical protein
MSELFPGRTEVNLKNRWARLNRGKIKSGTVPLGLPTPRAGSAGIAPAAPGPPISLPSIVTLMPAKPSGLTSFLRLTLNSPPEG